MHARGRSPATLTPSGALTSASVAQEFPRASMQAWEQGKTIYLPNDPLKEICMETINLVQKFSLFQETWQPRIVGEINDAYVKLVKLKGEFVWHKHEQEDELFLVIKGRLVIRLRDGELRIGEGEFAIIPRGVEHLPVADEEAQVLLLEPKTTRNTGDVQDERTVEPEWI
jgi:mannose-6-phosphate isomerase-like protein (cupin superfamily)